MRTLVVTTSYPRHANDAAGSFVKIRVDTLVAAGHEVEVLAAGEGEVAFAEIQGGVKIWRIPSAIPGLPPLFYGDGAPERLEAAPWAGWLGAGRFFFGLLAALRARLAACELVESHWLVPSTLAVMMAGFTGRHAAIAHSGDVALLERLPAGGACARAMIRAGVAFTFASANLRTRFAALAGPPLAERLEQAAIAPAESALVRHPARRLARGEREAKRARRGIEGPLVLGVGRLVPVKGYDRLVRAVGRLAPATRPTLVILGEGSERARLESMANARGVRLHLPGLVSPDAVRGWLGLADLFVHPARVLPGGRTEGTPVAVREALAAEVPVLATASGGLEELAARYGGVFALVDARLESDVVTALGAALGPALSSVW